MDEYIGIIKIFAPGGWAFCNGQLPNTAQHQDLFSIIGNTDGGDGAESMDGRVKYGL